MKQMYSAGIITYVQINDQPLYLLLHYTAGHWDLPKGTMEPNETKQEAALRELQEETGLNALIDPSFYEEIGYTFTNYDGKLTQKTVYFFIGKSASTHVILSHEHIDFAWLPYKNALMQLTYDNAKALLTKAHKHITSISRK